jgi:hypothetical protein
MLRKAALGLSRAHGSTEQFVASANSSCEQGWL